ncbi:MAG: biotin--[acetyl-CoA-carboxylase] ligase [Eubacteriales bacterium]|nr:biotin--[acetyl-CoA-carboxylase] ligase [Eubacteriales bacterium]
MSFNILTVGTVDSTNNYLKKLISEGAGHMTAVIAEAQTGGRGRQGKSFASPAGGIYISFYYNFPDMREEELPSVTPTVAVCVAEAIEKTANISVNIKWVNDIYYNGKKICGILTERSGTEKGFIVGIGINLSETGIPDELKEKAGYINADKATLTGCLTEKMDFTPAAFKDDRFLTAYKAKSYLTGKKIGFTRGNTEFTGTALDVDEHYRLRVMTDGGIMTLDCGEVSVIAL